MPEWLQQLLPAGLILGLVAYIWREHEKQDKERNDALWDQVGRKGGEGMRKSVHDVPGIRLRLDDVERRVTRIERHLNGHLKEEDNR